MTGFIELDAVASVDVPVTTTASSGATESILFGGSFVNVFIFSHSIRFALRSKMAIMAIIIVAITRPDKDITSASVPCGSPSIDTRGTEIETQGNKGETNKQTIQLVC